MFGGRRHVDVVGATGSVLSCDKTRGGALDGMDSHEATSIASDAPSWTKAYEIVTS